VILAAFFPVFGFPHLAWGSVYKNGKAVTARGYLLWGEIPHRLKRLAKDKDIVKVPEFAYKYSKFVLEKNSIKVECIDCCEIEGMYQVGSYRVIPLYYYEYKNTYRIVCSDSRFNKRAFIRNSLKNQKLQKMSAVREVYEKLTTATWKGFTPGWEGTIDYGDISLNWQIEPGVLDELEVEYGFTKEGMPVDYKEIAVLSCTYGNNDFMCPYCLHWGSDFCVHKPQ